MDIFDEFLELLDFSAEEIDLILPDWEQACKSLGLTEDDVRFAIDERRKK